MSRPASQAAPAAQPETCHRDCRTALRTLRKLLANGEDTAQASSSCTLNGGSTPVNYLQLLRTADGPRLAYDRVELADRFSDPALIVSFAPGTVGAACRHSFAATGYSAVGLADICTSTGWRRSSTILMPGLAGGPATFMTFVTS